MMRMKQVTTIKQSCSLGYLLRCKHYFFYLEQKNKIYGYFYIFIRNIILANFNSGLYNIKIIMIYLYTLLQYRYDNSITQNITTKV